jgi:hypothetical protein
MFRKVDLSLSSGEGKETPTLWVPLLTERRKQIQFSSYVEFQAMDKVQKASDSE